MVKAYDQAAQPLRPRFAQVHVAIKLAHTLDAAGHAEGALLQYLISRYRYALVDEFQDTDPIQWAIFRRIFFESDEGHALYVIGDPKQSIYAFRSADVHTYLEACGEVERAGGARVPLVDCYRSTAPMIEAINGVLASGFFTAPRSRSSTVTPCAASLPLVMRRVHALASPAMTSPSPTRAARPCMISRSQSTPSGGGTTGVAAPIQWWP